MKRNLLGLFPLVVFSLLLAGCQQEGDAAVTETEPAATMETAAATQAAPAGLLDKFSLVLTPNISRERVSDTRENLVRDGAVIGGIVVTDLDEAAVSDTERLVDYLQTNIIEGISPEDYDYYMGGSSKYALTEMECGNMDHGFTHYIYRGTSAFYDVWLEDTLLNTWEIQALTASVQSEDIPYSGESAFSLDQVTKISFDGLTLPGLDGLQDLWDAMQADLAAGTAIPDAGRHGAWFHYDAGVNTFEESVAHDNSYILLQLFTETDCFTFQIYPECENLMAWMDEQNVLNELGSDVVPNSWDVSFEVLEAEPARLVLRCTLESGHACRLQLEIPTVTGSFFLDNPHLYLNEQITFGQDGTAEFALDWTDTLGPLPAGDYQLKFYLRNSPPDTNSRRGYEVRFSISE